MHNSKNIQEKRSKIKRSLKDQLSVIKKNNRKRNKTNNKQRIALAKESGPNQKEINLSWLNLTSSQKSLLGKRPSFIPIPRDINWYRLRKDCTTFENQLRYKTKQSQSTSVEPSESTSNNITSSFHYHQYDIQDKRLDIELKKRTSKVWNCLLKRLRKIYLTQAPVRNVRPNKLKDEKEAIEKIRSWNIEIVHAQDKASCFFMLDNNDYEQKIQIQINRRSIN